MSIDIESLKYPIGKFQLPETIDSASIENAIQTLKSFPGQIFSAVSPFSAEQLNTPYRPGGWTIRQLIHHCADSHMNAFIRFKLALTEQNPTIKPYEEAEWAKLSDSYLPIEPSLELIKAIHLKWLTLLESMKAEDFKKTFFHPEKQKSQSLDGVTLMYAWHSTHHLAHVQQLVLRNFDR